MVPNGATNPENIRNSKIESLRIKEDSYNLLYISSAHLPNWTGIEELVIPVIRKKRFNHINLILAGGITSFYEDYVKRNGTLSNVITIPNFSDEEKAYLFSISSLVILPITSGGGTNLKTAEALLSSKAVLGTETSFRGFEAFKKSDGVTVVPDKMFRLKLEKKLINKKKKSEIKFDRPECQIVSWDSIVKNAIKDINEKMDVKENA